MPPKVTLIWLNFNSMHIKPLIEESLAALAAINYPNRDIILVDNGSTDGSFELIEDFAASNSKAGQGQLRVVRNEQNLGFVGGMNSGFRARDKDSTYCALVNNDAVIRPDSVNLLVGEMEKDPRLGAVQGVVSNIDGTRVDSAGGIIDELLAPRFLFDGEPLKDFGPMDVSFVEGTFPIYRIEAIESFLKGNIFIQEGDFYYLEDILNGLMLWNRGYRCATFPFQVARHHRKATITKYASSIHMDYYLWRNRNALLAMTDSRYRGRVERALEKAVVFVYKVQGKGDRASDISRGLAEGDVLGETLRAKYGFNIQLSKCPLVKLWDAGVNSRLLMKLVRSKFNLWRIPYV
jgi:hypothetical protein